MGLISNGVLILVALVLGFVGALWFGRRSHQTLLDAAVEGANAQARVDMATLRAQADARSAELDQLRGEQARLNVQIDGLRTELALARENLARAQTALDQEKLHAGEKLKLLEDARAALSDQFKVLAHEVLEEKSRTFSEQNRGQLDLLLRPLGEKLQSFEKKVEEAYITEGKERFSLAEEVRRLQATNLQISQEAVNLTRALKGESKSRGNWGEVVLERVLERSGLKKGVEYETQMHLDGESGALRPDVVVRLPEAKHIVIDSKVSLVAYDRYYAADDEASRLLALREHVSSMRKHIDDLASKSYQRQAGVNAPDFVAMFVPIEPAFNLAAGFDESLYLDAFDKKVVIVTPGTLLAMLSTVSTLWRRELQNKNAQEIAKRSGELYDKFVLFVEALADVGKKLGGAQDAYDDAFKRLSVGRGNIVRRLEQLKVLGAHADKQLSDKLLDGAGIEVLGAPDAGDDEGVE